MPFFDGNRLTEERLLLEETQMKNREELRKQFQNPGSEYRTAPLWVWNADMTDEEIERSLKELHDNGFGGAFVHPRPGMKISYLSNDYFAAWKQGPYLSAEPVLCKGQRLYCPILF